MPGLETGDAPTAAPAHSGAALPQILPVSFVCSCVHGVRLGFGVWGLGFMAFSGILNDFDEAT